MMTAKMATWQPRILSFDAALIYVRLSACNLPTYLHFIRRHFFVIGSKRRQIQVAELGYL
jgi:hypothetical protein